jgi:hypothetical protein
MAQFPRTEVAVARLAARVAAGLSEYKEVFPSPPVSPHELWQRLEQYGGAREVAYQAAARTKRLFALKHEALDGLTQSLKADIAYAEYTAYDDDQKLRLLGWGARKPRGEPRVPHQVTNLEVTHHGAGTFTLAWKHPPGTAGRLAYRIQRRHLGDGAWSDLPMTAQRKIRLTDQERDVELEYRVFAVNHRGAGKPSEPVTVVL